MLSQKQLLHFTLHILLSPPTWQKLKRQTSLLPLLEWHLPITVNAGEPTILAMFNLLYMVPTNAAPLVFTPLQKVKIAPLFTVVTNLPVVLRTPLSEPTPTLTTSRPQSDLDTFNELPLRAVRKPIQSSYKPKPRQTRPSFLKVFEVGRKAVAFLSSSRN